MKSYRERRTAERYELAVQLLGGCCAICNITNVKFEFDHIDPNTKTFTISTHLWDYSWTRLIAELEKCQLLCSPCHISKSAQEKSVEHGQGLSGKKNCKCQPCKERKAEYMKYYKMSWTKGRT